MMRSRFADMNHDPLPSSSGVQDTSVRNNADSQDMVRVTPSKWGKRSSAAKSIRGRGRGPKQY